LASLRGGARVFRVSADRAGPRSARALGRSSSASRTGALRWGAGARAPLRPGARCATPADISQGRNDSCIYVLQLEIGWRCCCCPFHCHRPPSPAEPRTTRTALPWSGAGGGRAGRTAACRGRRPAAPGPSPRRAGCGAQLQSYTSIHIMESKRRDDNSTREGRCGAQQGARRPAAIRMGRTRGARSGSPGAPLPAHLHTAASRRTTLGCCTRPRTCAGCEGRQGQVTESLQVPYPITTN
jgi:hypothetical protein